MAAWHARRARRALLCDAGDLKLQSVLSAAGAWHCGAPFNALMVDQRLSTTNELTQTAGKGQHDQIFARTIPVTRISKPRAHSL